GGHWGPDVASHFMSKSADINANRHCRSPHNCHATDRAITVSHLGILSGIVDFLVQGEHYPSFAVNNTYGIETISLAAADATLAAFHSPGGCKDLATVCQD